MKETSKVSNILLVFSLIIFSVSLVYHLIPLSDSRYLDNSGGTGDVSTAKWIIKVNGEQIKNAKTINLNDTITPNDYSNTKVIPGTNGYIKLEIDFSEVDVAIDYTLSIDDTSVPDNLHFYEDENYTNEITSLYVGSYNLDDNYLKKHDIYWRWNFTNDDESNWNSQNIYVAFNLNVTQRLGSDI